MSGQLPDWLIVCDEYNVLCSVQGQSTSVGKLTIGIIFTNNIHNCLPPFTGITKQLEHL